MILQQLKHEYNELLHYNSLLLNQAFYAPGRQRRGLINGIGYVANSLFGVLDERFAEKYENDIKQIRANQNHLSALWKNQTSVVEAEYNLLKRTEDLINKQHKIINKHLNDLDRNSAYINEQIRRLSIIEEFSLSSVTASNIINKLKRTQDTFLDTLTDIYHGKLNIHLITPEQLRSELQIISSHLSKDIAIPIQDIHNDLHEIYHLLKVRARMTPTYFIFEIKFPLISREGYHLYNIISVPHKIENNMVSVIPISDYIAINLQKDAYIITSFNELQNCLNHQEIRLYRLRSPIRRLSVDDRFCVIDKEIKDCKVNKKACEKQLIKLTSDYSFMYFYCQSQAWKIFCDEQMFSLNVKGAGIIYLSEKCMVKGKDFSILPHKSETLRNTLHMNPESTIPEIPAINYLFNISFPNITLIADSAESENITNSLNHLQKQIQLMKKNTNSVENDFSSHDVHQYVISYGTLIIVIVIALGGLVWCRKRRRVHVLSTHAPASAQRMQQHESVGDSRCSHSRSENVRQCCAIEMVDVSTSPRLKKCVRFSESAVNV